MSKILEKLALKPKPVESKTESKIVDYIAKARARVLSTASGIAHVYGTDDELDLMPLSKTEDLLFVYDGSPVAYYCEKRLQERSAEDALMAVFKQSKRMLCGKCGKLFRKCRCGGIFSGLIGDFEFNPFV